LWPPTLTQQQKLDLELYGVYIEAGEEVDDDIEIGAEVIKRFGWGVGGWAGGWVDGALLRGGMSEK